MAGLLDAVQSALTSGSKAVTGLATGVSTMLSSKDKVSQENSNIIYASFGMAGSAARQNISGSGTLPAAQARSTYKAKSNNTEKLLTDVVRYLVSINSTLKKQIDFDRRVYEENALAAREAKIEQNSIFEDLGKRYGANDNQKDGAKGGILSIILSTLGSFAKLGLKALFEGLKKAIGAFRVAWSWIRGLSFLSNIKNLLSLARALPIGPIAAALAGAGAIVWGVDKIMKDAYADADKKRQNLEQMYGMKAVTNEQGFTTGYVLPDGKTYKPEDLPSKYKDILEAYGPNNRGGTSDAARKRIEANKTAYEPDAMTRELKGGEQVGAPPPGATQTTSTTSQSAYDVVLGYGKFGKPEDYFNGRKLSQLTVAEALWFGRNVLLPNSGSMNSSAMGAYQIVSKTLQGLVDQGVIKLTDTFNAATQDKAAKAIYDQANKAGTLNKQWAYYIPGYGGTGQRTDPRSFEEAKMDILKKEGTLRGTNDVAMSPAVSSSSSGLLQQATDAAADAADSMLTSVAEFIGTIGGKIVGPGVARNLTTTGPDFAKLISDESNKIQNQIALGEKKTSTTAANIPSAAQTLKSISPNGSISVIDPNYPGTGGIEKYLGHYKLAP